MHEAVATYISMEQRSIRYSYTEITYRSLNTGWPGAFLRIVVLLLEAKKFTLKQLSFLTLLAHHCHTVCLLLVHINGPIAVQPRDRNLVRSEPCLCVRWLLERKAMMVRHSRMLG